MGAAEVVGARSEHKVDPLGLVCVQVAGRLVDPTVKRSRVLPGAAESSVVSERVVPCGDLAVDLVECAVEVGLPLGLRSR